MRDQLIEQLKSEIKYKLEDFLSEQGIDLRIAANDNIASNIISSGDNLKTLVWSKVCGEKLQPEWRAQAIRNKLFAEENDNPSVELETIEDKKLSGSKLLYEIRVILGVLGKNWQCDALIEGIYYALHPYNITVSELTVLLMSIHIEYINKPQKERAIISYIVERNQTSS